MATMQMATQAANGIGGYIQGNFGNYSPSADGTYTVDTRDVAALLVLGFSYVRQQVTSYTLPLAPAVATIATIVASGALSNATLTIAAQPDTMRPVTFEWGTGTTAITAGNVVITYVGNDGASGVDTFPLALALSTASTLTLSRGVVSITSAIVSGLTGGTSPWRRMSTTAAVSLPVAPGAVDFAVIREYDAGATIAIGALATALGSITPTTAPNGTVTYSFGYNYIAPTT